MKKKSLDSFKTKSTLKLGKEEAFIYRLDRLSESGFQEVSKLPFTLKIVLENLLRHEDGEAVDKTQIEALARWPAGEAEQTEIAFHPARVLLQDFTGVPAVVDLAAMREALRELGGDPQRINPLEPVDLVIDHSVQVDFFGTPEAFQENSRREYERNKERYGFLKWGQRAFKNFRVIPPETGIVHQVNLEYLAPLVFETECSGSKIIYPDTLVGTDSHTTMINGLGVLGWGVGGIEAEAAMLGQPLSLLIPQVVGLKLTGKLAEGTTATDAVLTVTQILRSRGVVGKYVEFFGPGLSSLSLPDRATLSNMCPEYGATVGFFPVDDETLNYLRLTGRDEALVRRVEAYAQAQGIFWTKDTPDPTFTETVELDLSSVEPSLAGPSRPQDRVTLSGAKQAFRESLPRLIKGKSQGKGEVSVGTGRDSFSIKHGSVVIAAITSCTNTSNPFVMMGAGLLAKKAIEKGLQIKPWVKTSLAPGSRVVMDYLERAGLVSYLEKLKFHLVGYGCTTCIGNSGPLPEPIAEAVKEGGLVAVAVLSGNRNFEGRINPLVQASYLASPPLVVAYALAGSIDHDLYKQALGRDREGNEVYLKDIWPSADEVREAISSINAGMYRKQYAHVFEGDDRWKAIQAPEGSTFAWDPQSTYVKRPTFLTDVPKKPGKIHDIQEARCLALLGDSVTTDHISPAGAIAEDSPAGKYLVEKNIKREDFNSFGSRRGNHEVMLRGTFGNIRLRNQLVPGTEGGWTSHQPSGEVMWIFDASSRYAGENIPLIVMAGKEYGSGSSRDWAAKGTFLLGVKAVIAQSFERIHRSNLVGMGVLPLEFMEGESAESLGLDGTESYTITGVKDHLSPGKRLSVGTKGRTGVKTFETICRIDTPRELDYYRNGGILPYVLRQLA
jgi:aconitate hydratase